MKLIKTNSFKVHHVVCCCYHSNHNDWFSNLLLLFLKMSLADLYLQAFWSIYWIGQILVIREPSPFSKADHLFQNHLSKRQCTFHFKKRWGREGEGREGEGGGRNITQNNNCNSQVRRSSDWCRKSFILILLRKLIWFGRHWLNIY